MRLAAAFLVALAVAAFPAGYVVGRSNVPLAAPTQLRPSEAPGPAGHVVDGPLAFRVLAWRCGLRAVAGDHADWLPDGQYCRVRVRIENLERGVTAYETALQELVDERGRAYPADLNSVQISDQPTTLQVKSYAAYEFDVWFDVPRDADVAAARFRAARGRPGVTLPLAQ